MKKTKIIYSWTKGGKSYQKEIDREDFFVMFDGLKKGFQKIGNNEISKKLVQIIPEVSEIIINYDVNETQDIPHIVYNIDGNVHLIKINRLNDIVWSILDKYCTE